MDKILAQVTDQQLAEWASTKPCQIRPLARIINDDLEFDPVAPTILFRLISNRTLRDAFLQENPSLLPQVASFAADILSHSEVRLTSSVGTESPLTCCQAETVYLNVVKAPLPSLVALPASFQDLLENLLENRNGYDSNVWLSKIRNVLGSTPVIALEAVPDQVLQVFTEKWNKMLRANDCVKMFLSLSIAIRGYEYAIAAPTQSSFVSTQSNRPAALVDWFEKCRSIFDGHRSEELVSAVGLRVLAILRSLESSPISPDVLEAVSLLPACLHTVKPAIIKRWAPPNERVIQKLADKAGKDVTPSALQFVVLQMLLVLDRSLLYSDPSLLMQRLVSTMTTDACTSALTDHPDDDVAPEGLIQALPPLLEQNAGAANTTLGKDIVAATVGFVLDQCRPGRPLVGHSANLHRAMSIADSMRKTIKSDGSHRLAESILQRVNIDGIPEWWLLSLSDCTSMSNCADEEICRLSIERKRQNLCLEVSLIVLECVSASHSTIRGQDFNLLQKQILKVAACEGLRDCQYSNTDGLRGNVRMSVGNTQHIDGRRWEEELNSHFGAMTGNAKMLMESIINARCKDLHDRCDTVEEPLRIMTSKAERLQRESDEVNKELFAANSQNKVLVSDLEAEKAGRRTEERRASKLETEVEQLREAHHNIQQDLVEAHEEARILKVGAQQQVERLLDLRKQQAEDYARSLRQLQTDSQATGEAHDQALSEIRRQLQNQTESVGRAATETEWVKQKLQYTEKTLKDQQTNHAEELQQLGARRQADITALEEQHEMDVERAKAQYADDVGALRQAHRAEMELVLAEVGRNNAIWYDKANSVLQKEDLNQLLSQKAQKTQQLEDLLDENKLQIQHNTESIRILQEAKNEWKTKEQNLQTELKKARKTEGRVLALLQGRSTSQASPSSRSPTTTPRQPRKGDKGLVVSEDDEDYSELTETDKHA